MKSKGKYSLHISQLQLETIADTGSHRTREKAGSLCCISNFWFLCQKVPNKPVFEGMSLNQNFGQIVEAFFDHIWMLNETAVRICNHETEAQTIQPDIEPIYPDLLRPCETDVSQVHIGSSSIWAGDTGNSSPTRGESITGLDLTSLAISGNGEWRHLLGGDRRGWGASE